MEVPIRTNDHHSIVVQIGFLFGVGYFDKIKNISYLCFAIDLGSLEMDSWVFPSILYLMELNCIIGILFPL